MEQQIFDWFVGIILALVAWFAKTMHTKIEKLEDEIQSLQVTLPTLYVFKADLNARFDRQDQILQKILDKLDTKEDKHK